MGDTPDTPFFRFHPGVYETPAMKRDGRCEACGKDGWIYRGVIYTSRHDAKVCAQCIADDKLGALLDDATFTLHDIQTDGMRPDLEKELLQRTPGVACFNPFRWPSIDGVPLAFVGTGDNPAFWADSGARAAMQKVWRDASGQDLTEPTGYLLMFRALDKGPWDAVIDLD